MNNQPKNNPDTLDARRMFIYFSQLMDLPVVDKDLEPAGRVYDIVVMPTQVYPQSSRLIIRKGLVNHKYALINWSQISRIENKQITLAVEAGQITFAESHDNKEELTLRRDILDQQVVDISNHKVIRINDIHLLMFDHSFMAAHVDISLRGLIRRLGLERIIDFIVRLFNKNARYLTTEHLISWKHIHPLSISPVSMTIKVDIPHKQFSNIPAADLGEIFLDLDIKHQVALFKSLDLNNKAKTFMSVDFRTQKSIMEELAQKDAVELLSNIPTDEATDFLEKLPREQMERFLNLMETKQSKKLSQLLGYSSDSAGGLMTADFMAFTKNTSVEAVLKQIKERPFKAEPAQFVYIVDENQHFIGSTNFRRLLLANPLDPIQNAAFPRTYPVRLDSSVKEVAYLMDKYKYYAIPVVDEQNVLQGIITVDDILSQVISLAWRRFKKIKIQPKQ